MIIELIILENHVTFLYRVFSSLKKLEIFGCHALTDKCLRSVAVKCPDLEVLDIGRIHKITEECLAKVISSMKKLTSVNLTGLNMVSR